VASSDETTTLLLATGELVVVSGRVDDVAKAFENAARSGTGTLAWFDEAQGDERLGVNPAHIVSIRRAG
jgi:hypothetical protein